MVAAYKLNCNDWNRGAATQESVEQEQQEELVIRGSHRVPNPWAIVVHLDDASTSYTIMVCARWFEVIVAFATTAYSFACKFLFVLMNSR